MLSIKLRTIGMKEIMELWETNKKKLKLKLLDDYHDLAKEYRNQIKIYNQEGQKSAAMYCKYISCEKINYQAELDIDEHIRGRIKFTDNFNDNLRIGNEVYQGMLSNYLQWEASTLAESIRLKASEIENILNLLHVKVSHYKDFEKYHDQWLHEDLEELRMQEIKEANAKEQEMKERAECIIEELEEEGDCIEH